MSPLSRLRCGMELGRRTLVFCRRHLPHVYGKTASQQLLTNDCNKEHIGRVLLSALCATNVVYQFFGDGSHTVLQSPRYRRRLGACHLPGSDQVLVRRLSRKNGVETGVKLGGQIAVHAVKFLCIVRAPSYPARASR